MTPTLLSPTIQNPGQGQAVGCSVQSTECTASSHTSGKRIFEYEGPRAAWQVRSKAGTMRAWGRPRTDANSLLEEKTQYESLDAGIGKGWQR